MIIFDLIFRKGALTSFFNFDAINVIVLNQIVFDARDCLLSNGKANSVFYNLIVVNQAVRVK